MQKVLDLHLHSPFARACSPRISPENIARTCEIKGVDIVGTADFTHPEWFAILEKNLVEEKSSGLYKLKDGSSKTLFIFSTEVSLIYKQDDRTRKIHLVVQAPNVEVVRELNGKLAKSFNLRSDGRPILGISAPKFIRSCLDVDPKILIYPAHIWTPWYSVFGAKSGFDSLKECFQEELENIYAFETGLSSDPQMNWQLSLLDNLTCLSNSDAHSLENIGREANIMELSEISYANIYRVIRNNLKVVAGDSEGMIGTIEFYPEEGKYHLDGHRQCNYSCSPKEGKKNKGVCPVCNKPLIMGLSHRIMDLADRPESYRPKFNVPTYKQVALDKIIATSLEVKSSKSKKVQKIYQEMINDYGPEIHILKDLNLENLFLHSPKTAEGIKRVRLGKLNIKAGFDGKYGVISII